METKMEELKMCHITSGKGQRGEKSLLQTSVSYQVPLVPKTLPTTRDGLPLLSQCPESVPSSLANEVVCFYQMCSEQNSTWYFECVSSSYRAFTLGAL